MPVMTRKKNLGDRQALPDGWSRILGMFKQTFGKGLLFRRCLIPKHARYKSDCRINQGLSGDLAPRKDEIAQ